MKNPFAGFSPKAVFAQLRDPRNLNWKAVAVIAIVIIGGVLLYRKGEPLLFSEENAPAGTTIAGALESFKRVTGKYPEKLEHLKPAQLKEIPQPVAGTNFVYGVSGDGKDCAFGYQVFRGVLMEYECGERKWAYREYEDSYALRSFRREFVMGPK
jgi:hypothetical protein